MGKKMAKAGLFSLAALGAGAAVFMAGKKEKGCAKKCTAPKEKKQTDYSDYRNTERDKQKKNSKGIYYTKGNEVFACKLNTWEEIPQNLGIGSGETITYMEYVKFAKSEAKRS